MVSLVDDDKLYVRYMLQALCYSLRTANLYALRAVHRHARCNDAVANTHGRKGTVSLFQQFFAMHDEQRPHALELCLGNHPADCHGLSCAAGGDSAYAPRPLFVGGKHIGYHMRLIRPQGNHQNGAPYGSGWAYGGAAGAAGGAGGAAVYPVAGGAGGVGGAA